MKGKLIVIEGTDCSGKETQSNLLVERLLKDNVSIVKFSFPNYDTPTGKIIGGPYLGKSYIGPSWFQEGAANVEPKIASLYYAADRLYNIQQINDVLNSGTHVLLDRYTFSNMGHQAGKLLIEEKRFAMYDWLENLEFNLLNLPRPDISVFLHLPFEYACQLKKERVEKPDGHEVDEQHLRSAEKAYIEIAKKYNFDTIKCYEEDKIRSIENINDELYELISKQL